MGISTKFAGLVLLLLCCFCPAIAQLSSASLSFEISIPQRYKLPSSGTDADRLQAFITASPIAGAALSGVRITSFHQKYPGSHYQYLRSIYQLTCAHTASNDSAILSLHSADPIDFPYVQEASAILPLGGTYIPDDFHGTGSNDCSAQLNYIHAPAAWGVTRGNPKITIGINDPSGFDVTNPDLVGKIISVDSNNYPDFHGTVVAGCAAAHTDNDRGVAAIGFNCTLALELGGDEFNLSMSAAGLRVINNSWFYYYGCSPSYQPGVYVESELIYDETYENGASTCFAAGNGLSGEGHCESLFDYTYPASLDHIISVGPVGQQNPLGTLAVVNSLCPPAGVPWLWYDCHEEIPGDALGKYGGANYEANDRVDICAPAYNVVSTDYAPGDTAVHYTSQAAGTSFASPIVAGTIGLMLSALPCLSPYQVEYLLKTNARNIDHVEYPPGSGINLNAPYVGKMGAGALDAGAAVTAAGTFDCNDTNTQTMYIEGIELNTICAPGFSASGIKPILSPVIDHGTPPYTYRWDPIPGNNTTLDNYASANPTVVSGNFAAYRLGVYDASPVPKEASRLIAVILTNAQTPMLLMRDSYMDMLDEPSTQASYDSYDWQLWLSPDIVNRTADDHTLVNQNPVYAPSTANYATARIRNVGCKASSGTDLLDMYWAKASTGETWPTDWTTATYTNTTTKASWPAGGQITATPLTIPALAPGAEDTMSAPWYPPNPQNYDASTESVDISLLARIETSSAAPYGMTTPEVANTALNASNNAKIVTRDLVVNNPSSGDIQWHQILLANTGDTDRQFSLEFATEKQLYPSFSGDISAYAGVKVELGDLYDRWIAGGSKGSNILVDPTSKSVVVTGDSRIVLSGITIHAHEKVAARVGILLQQQPVSDQYFHIRQWLDTISAAVPVPYGDVSILIPACAGCRLASDQAANSVPFATGMSVYPNPASNSVTLLYTGFDANTLSYAVSDISGQVLFKQSGLSVIYGSENTIDITSLSVGLYFIKLTDQRNNSMIVKMVKD